MNEGQISITVYNLNGRSNQAVQAAIGMDLSEVLGSLGMEQDNIDQVQIRRNGQTLAGSANFALENQDVVVIAKNVEGGQK